MKKVQISLRGLALAPTISELRNMMQGICQNELEKTIRNIDQLDVEERNKMDMMINSIVNKILHYPITNLKQADSNDSQKRLLESIHYLFNL